MTPETAAEVVLREMSAVYHSRLRADLPPPPPEDGGDESLPPLESYRHNPLGFFREVLGWLPTADQEMLTRALPGRVKVESGHSCGKSSWMAVVCLWWFYTRNPSVVICNAPSKRAIEDVLWTEIRLIHARAKRPLPDFFIGPKAPEMYDTPDHWAKGYVTSKGEAYQGRHRDNMLFLTDEDEAVSPIFWETTGTMYRPGEEDCWVAACNPITTASASYNESMAVDADGNPKWKLFRISSLDHPNITAELEGRKPPVPGAVSLGQVKQWLADWTTRIDALERTPTDVEFPKGSGKWYRPGPLFQSRVLGLRPTGGVNTVWPPAVFEKMLEPRWSPRECWLRNSKISIGVDVAAFGDDDTALHVRSGPLALHHEWHNGWSPGQTAGRVKELSCFYADWYNGCATEDRPPLNPLDVETVIELDGGYGVGVLSHQGEFRNWRGITVGGAADVLNPDGSRRYANMRAQVWFEAAEVAGWGGIDISRLSPEAKARLRQQLTAPYYDVKPDGSRLIEPKAEIKKRLGRSPDSAEALILSHAKSGHWLPKVVSRADDD